MPGANARRISHATPASDLGNDESQDNNEGHHKHGDADDAGLVDATDDWEVDEFASA